MALAAGEGISLMDERKEAWKNGWEAAEKVWLVKYLKLQAKLDTAEAALDYVLQQEILASAVDTVVNAQHEIRREE